MYKICIKIYVYAWKTADCAYPWIFLLTFLTHWITKVFSLKMRFYLILLHILTLSRLQPTRIVRPFGLVFRNVKCHFALESCINVDWTSITDKGLVENFYHLVDICMHSVSVGAACWQSALVTSPFDLKNTLKMF